MGNFKGFKNEFEIAEVNVIFVFEPSSFYCMNTAYISPHILFLLDTEFFKQVL